MRIRAKEFEPEVATPSSSPTPGVGEAAKEVADRLKTIITLELELAKLEVRRKIASFFMGIALLVAAGVFALFMLGFLFSAVAAAFDTFMAAWLARLATGGILFVLTLLLALLGLRSLRKGTPVPQRAIQEAKLTTEALKSDGTG
jgi:uncharacterized membrane protein YqjE